MSVAAMLDVDDHGLLFDAVSALAPRRGSRQQSDGSYMVLCPGHDDKQPSLQVGVAKPGHKYRLTWYCHAGCTVPRIREAAMSSGVSDEAFAPRRRAGNGSRPSNGRRIDCTYPYHDETEVVLYETVRYSPKGFRQRHPDGKGDYVWNLKGVRRVIYRLPEVRRAVEQDRWVVLVEGEKDADRLARDGIVATCSPMGAGKWRDEYASSLTGAKVAIIPDNDDPGRAHAAQAASSLHGVASSLRVVTIPGLPDKGDAFDWLEQGHDAAELKAAIDSAVEWEPPDEPPIPNGHEEGVYLTRASQIEPEQVTYFDEGLIPLRVVTIMSGVDGVGKSTVLYTKAAAATCGKLPGAFYGTPVDVVIASSEDHPGSVIIPRLVAAGADLERVHVVKCRKYGIDGDIALPEDLPNVADAVKRVGARLLIVDPLVGHLPMSVDSYKAQHVRGVLAPMAHLCEDNELAVVAVVHFNGAPSTDIRTRISGSKALRDAARSVLVCGENPDDKSGYVMAQDKHSFGPRPTTGKAYRIESRQVEIRGRTFTTSAVVWGGEVEVNPRGLLAGPEDEGQRNETDAAVAFLEDALGDDEMKATDVRRLAKQEGHTSSALKRAKKKAGVESVKRGRSQGINATSRLIEFD